jgi:hypothetical protein
MNVGTNENCNVDGGTNVGLCRRRYASRLVLLEA